MSALVITSGAVAQTREPTYKRATAPVAARVRDLLGRMTLEEKVAQLESQTTLPLSGAAAGLVNGEHVDPAVARRTLAQGIGTLALIDVAGGLGTPATAVAQRNAVQAWVMQNTRLGIPVLFHSEALHGAVVGGATSFPQAIALGSTWDRALVREVFGVAAKESRAVGNPLVLAPVLDLARDPRFGRVEEMYSEDPYLVGELGLAAVQGLQGAGPQIDQDHVLATAKHFVHGQPENGTNVGPNDVSERTMRDVFLRPFEKAVRVGRIAAVMPSYNENNGGVPSNANSWLLKDVLRHEWGFAGLTLSDYGAVQRLNVQHHLVADDAGAGVLAFNSGVDMELAAPAGFPALVGAVRSGRVAEKDIDAAVARVLTAKFNLGLFEHPFADPERARRLLGAREHAQLARRAADESVILLKNEGGLLPLDASKIRKLAIIGPNADKVRLGGYSGAPPYFVTVLEGVRRRVGANVEVVYAEGCRISEPDASPLANTIMPYQAPSAATDDQLIAQAVHAAQSADAVVLVLGGNESVSRETLGPVPGYGVAIGDTDTLKLPGRQDDLVRQIAKLGKPTVAVLLNGRPYAITELTQSAPAILEGWYLGQETGNAVAGLLFGDVNPSGRLPVTIARDVGQLPAYYYRSPAARGDYVFHQNTPLFPFGFGLSYTKFSYGKPTLDRAQISRQGSAKVTVTVTNTGPRAGDDVVQMYVHHDVSSVVQPVRALRGFQRVRLEPGQSEAVTFAVGPEQLAILDQHMMPSVEPGAVDVMIGANAAETVGVKLQILP